jgi:hypothetical protein
MTGWGCIPRGSVVVRDAEIFFPFSERQWGPTAAAFFVWAPRQLFSSRAKIGRIRNQPYLQLLISALKFAHICKPS